MADFAQSILRQIRDMVENPRLYAEMVRDRIDNYNKGQVAEGNRESIGNRKLSRDERVKQMTDDAIGNLGGGGMGALGVIKAKGGNWLNGSVEKALEPIMRHISGRARQMDQELVEAGMPRSPNILRQEALNKWIEGPLTKYVKRDMATEGDPVRRLAEQNILHVSPDNLMGGLIETHPTGEFVQKLGRSDPAKRWENASDRVLWMDRVSELGAKHRVDNPWLYKTDPKSEVYSVNDALNLHNDLGFDHLVDELSNALNPESGLPRNLLLNPEDFQQMGMERAVRHVDNINKWRAAQKAEADANRANNAATALHKEYPENNPLGLRWVELKAPDRLPDEAAKEEFGDIGRYAQAKLRDALKYEGDNMGHCVGGYCDDVLSGKSRIYSLRDAKGQPHVTIETQKGYGDARFDAPEELQAKWNEDAHREAKLSGLKDEDDIREYVMDRIGDYADYWLAKQPKDMSRIIQIKGKQNLAPKEEYLPFVQDFVKSGNWSDVGDLRNTGLMKNKFDQETLSRYGKEYQPYVTQQELDDIMSAIDGNGSNKPEFANGGLVSSDGRTLPFTVHDGIISNIAR